MAWRGWSAGQVGMKVVMTSLTALSAFLGPPSPPAGSVTLSQGFLAGRTEQPRTGVGGI